MKNQKNVKLTPKQANIAAANLLRGLDNSINDAKRHTAKLEDFKAKVSSLSAGLSNLASVPPAKAASPSKPAAKKAVKPAPKVKPAAVKPAAVKPSKASKPAPAKPAPAKPAPAKPAKAPAKPAPKSDEQKPPVQGRPSIRQAVKDLLRGLPAGGTIHTTEAYAKIVSKYGYWSKQTFYGLVNNDPEISNADSQLSMASGQVQKAEPKPKAPKAAAVVTEAAKDDRVDSLVRKVEQDKSTSAVV